MKTGRTRWEMEKYIAESKEDPAASVSKFEKGRFNDAVSSIRSDLMKGSSRLSAMASLKTHTAIQRSRFKKAEDLVDKARKILFDLQD